MNQLQRSSEARQRHESVREIATILSKLLPEQTMADLMNCLLCCNYEEALSDAEAETGSRLFDLLTEMRPDAVSVAVRG